MDRHGRAHASERLGRQESHLGKLIRQHDGCSIYRQLRVTNSSVALLQPHRFDRAEHVFVEIDHLGCVADAEIGRHCGCTTGNRFYCGWHGVLLTVIYRRDRAAPRLRISLSARSSLVSSDLPNIAEWVPHCSAAVATEHILWFLNY